VTLSLLITSHNDNEECRLTVESARQNAVGDVEIVVLDDASPAPLPTQSGTVHCRTSLRAGVGPGRYLAACRASGDWLLIVDSHCRFEPNWDVAALAVAASRSERVIWNFQCVGLAPGDMDMSKPHGHYHGSNILFTGPDPNRPATWQVLEGKWQPDQGDDVPVGGLMGACYMVQRDWFFQMGALKMLRYWGSDEPDLALRSWLCGGECRFTKAVRVGHQFRQVAHHRNPTGAMVFNKMLVALVCLPQLAAERLIADLPKQYRLAGDIAVAHKWIAEVRPVVECERAFLLAQQAMSFEAYCERFAVARFW